MNKTAQKVREAYECIRNGGLVLVPTNVAYGLIGHSEDAIRKMFALKGRSLSNPCVTFGNLSVLKKLSDLDEKYYSIAEELAKKYMLSLVIPIKKDSQLTSKLSPYVYQHAVTDETIALYMNLGEFSDKLVELGEKDDLLLVGSSANLSHTGNNYTFEDVEQSIKNGVDFMYDSGLCPYHHPTGRPGTIVDIASLQRGDAIKFVRKGALYPEIYGAIRYMLTGKVEYPFDMDSYLEGYGSKNS